MRSISIGVCLLDILLVLVLLVAYGHMCWGSHVHSMYYYYVSLSVRGLLFAWRMNGIMNMSGSLLLLFLFRHRILCSHVFDTLNSWELSAG